MSETLIPLRRRAFVDGSPIRVGPDAVPANRSGVAELRDELRQLRADVNALRNVLLDQAVAITGQEATIVALAELAIQTGKVANRLLRCAPPNPPNRTDE